MRRGTQLLAIGKGSAALSLIEHDPQPDGTGVEGRLPSRSAHFTAAAVVDQLQLGAVEASAFGGSGSLRACSLLLRGLLPLVAGGAPIAFRVAVAGAPPFGATLSAAGCTVAAALALVYVTFDVTDAATDALEVARHARQVEAALSSLTDAVAATRNFLPLVVLPEGDQFGTWCRMREAVHGIVDMALCACTVRAGAAAGVGALAWLWCVVLFVRGGAPWEPSLVIAAALVCGSLAPITALLVYVIQINEMRASQVALCHGIRVSRSRGVDGGGWGWGGGGLVPNVRRRADTACGGELQRRARPGHPRGARAGPAAGDWRAGEPLCDARCACARAAAPPVVVTGARRAASRAWRWTTPCTCWVYGRRTEWSSACSRP